MAETPRRALADVRAMAPIRNLTAPGVDAPGMLPTFV
jgi:hypothetical protein